MSTQTVLNVDDNAANRYLKSRALRQAGFQVIEAATAREALDLAAGRRPDLVLLDIQLPDMSGLDVCRQLKEDPLTRAIPVVHISATFVDDQAKSSSVQAGAEVYLAEPIGPQELTSTIRTVMRLRAAELAVAENEQRLRLATEGAGIATWELGADGAATVWSAQFRAMLGLASSGEPAGLATWLERVRDDERALVEQALEDALRQVRPLSLEHWVVRADTGEERCIAVYGSAQRGADALASRLIGVAMDVTERRRAEAERERLLAQARAGQLAAEEAARMKDEFLAILSHELRTPMSSVLGWLHLARRPDLPQPERDRALEVVERNARLQVQLVNDLLDVSRIVTGKLGLEHAAAGLDKVLLNAVESARLAAGTRTIELQIAPQGPWTVRGSEPRLAQIFGNLLSNAIKFSPEGSCIRVRMRREGGEARVSVSDEGEGLAAEVLPRIFDVFRQADSSTRRRHGGLGLGLAIVKSLVELHGGRIRAESAGLGKGASFIVALPLSGDAEPKAADAGEAQRASLAGVSILLVDDEADHLEMTASMLRMEGALVVAAPGASEALAAVGGWRPDVMVLDIAMPGTDGYELLELLRSVLGTAAGAVPALALTGFAAGADAERAAAAGFQGHLAKPFRLEALRSLILKLTGS